MKKLLLAATLLAGAAGAAGIAKAELSPLLGTMNADNVTLYSGLKVYPLGSFHPMGAIYTIKATATTIATSGAQVLATYSLPANALDTAGRNIRIRAMFAKAANGDTITPAIYFGSETIGASAYSTSGAGTVLELNVVKTGASTQAVWGQGYTNTTPIAPYSVAAASETDTSAITIKAACTAVTTGGDCTLVGFTVEYLN